MTTDSPEDSAPAEEPLDDLAADLYDTLRGIARRVLAGGPAALDGTDLVNEAYVRLARTDRYDHLSRGAFLALCATVVRRLMLEEARRRSHDRHARTRITSSEIVEALGEREPDVLALEDALGKLARIDPRQARIVELRFFGGMTGDEVADHLGLSRRTVVKEWALARAWLRRELERER
ncbi:MAG: sigma-70 family RNA polymerase sigma factor [Planctomycetes bacterium]|nr:sigma-70 family RNA polymerase sigma factor [Planctomycetota bacterium]